MMPALLDFLTIFFLAAGLLLLWLNLREWRRRNRIICEVRPTDHGDARVKAKPPGLPSDITRGFVVAMRKYFAEQESHIRNAIAAEQLDVLTRYQDPRDEPLRLSDVKNMFDAMCDVCGSSVQPRSAADETAPGDESGSRVG